MIVVLLGCAFALALRAADEGYQVVGEAYCENVMDGEMFVGSLPPDIDMFYNRGQIDYPLEALLFYERSTGLARSVDPRLPPLPESLEVIERRSRLPLRYRHKETGEIRDCFSDPRLDIAAFGARGVQLQDFLLI